jgi:GNAT superfamily N-acetyltransferase
MLLRHARLADADAIARVHVASWHHAYRELIPADRLANFTVERRTQAWRHNLSGRGPGRTIVADAALAEPSSDSRATGEPSPDIVGFASTGPSRGERGWGEIWALYVHPRAWGTGIGSALFADAMGYLTSLGYARTLIWILDGNQRAIEFYAGNGFALDGTRVVEDGYPQVRMRK